MAGEDGKTAHLLELYEELRRVPYKFDFQPVLRRLECLHRNRPRVGESNLPREDPIRLGQEPSLRFEPAALHGLEDGAAGKPPRLLVTFFGLFGPNGPLPLHMTDHVRERIRHGKDPTFARFADIFHHRMLQLLYRCWANAQPTASFDRPEDDQFGEFVGSLFGIGTPECHTRDAMPDLAKRHFAGRLACQTHNREGLETIIRTFFMVAVEIEQFVGHWMRLPDSCRWRMGVDPATGVLGQSAVAGSSVWDRQYKFRIILGPLDYDDFQRFLPTGQSLRRLVAVVRNYLGDELTWDVNLVLAKDQVPQFQLGRSGHLGWNSWAASRPHGRDVDDLCLVPERHGEFGR